MFEKSPKYWVACSGGVDSVFLARILHLLKWEIGILHCNFHLRAEDSNEDERFVRALAEKLNVPIRVKQFDVFSYKKEHKINTQLAARELRYHWFDKIIKEEKKAIVLAHHKDDQIETFFLQLRRGGQVKGLAGMPIFKDGYLRPLLNHSKKEMIAIAQKQNWNWREDSSNTSNDYTRNWYRNEVLPFLIKNAFPMEEVVPLTKKFQSILKTFQKQKIPTKIKIEEWKNYPIWWQKFILDAHHLGEFSTKEVLRLVNAEKGKYLANEQSAVWNESDFLLFVKKQKDKKVQLILKEIPKENTKYNISDLFFDSQKTSGKLSARKWKKGDVFQPLGMKGEKTVAKFLRDRKVPSSQKENHFVLTDKHDQIIGIFGFGISEKYKIDENTKSVVHAKIEAETK